MTPLILRPWRFTDTGAVLDAFAAPDMAAQAAEPVVDADAARRWIEWAAALRSTGTGAAYAVVEDDHPIGNVAVSGLDRHSCAWVSYWTAPAARGRGVTSDALRAAVAHWHDDAGIDRLELGYRVGNPASGRVAAAAGFLVEGRQRGKLRYDGVRHDVEIAARLTDDPRTTPVRTVRVVTASDPL